MRWVCCIGGVLGLIWGGVAGYLQSENEGNATHLVSAKSDINGLVDNPKVNSIEVVSNE